jgi:hypothetical protein
MPASIIPVTGLILGPIGSVSQTDFPITTPRLINPTDTLVPNFGDALVLNSNNTYSSVAQYISVDSSSVTGTTPIAFAQANVKTNTYYPTNGSGTGTIANSGNYPAGSEADALTRGTINVAVPYGTPAGAGAGVYIRTATNGSYPNSWIGAIEGSPLTGNVLMTNGVVFKTGILSTDSATGQITAQVTILNRLIP